MLPEAASTGRRKKAELECKKKVKEKEEQCFSLALSLSLLSPFHFDPDLAITTSLYLSLSPSAEDPRHAVDDRGPLPVQPPPPLPRSSSSSSSSCSSGFLPLLSSFAAVAAAAVAVRDPDEKGPLAHRPDGVPAVLPRALLARDLEPGREGDEALVVVPGRVFFRFRFR